MKRSIIGIALLVTHCLLVSLQAKDVSYACFAYCTDGKKVSGTVACLNNLDYCETNWPDQCSLFETKYLAYQFDDENSCKSFVEAFLSEDANSVKQNVNTLTKQAQSNSPNDPDAKKANDTLTTAVCGCQKIIFEMAWKFIGFDDLEKYEDPCDAIVEKLVDKEVKGFCPDESNFFLSKACDFVAGEAEGAISDAFIKPACNLLSTLLTDAGLPILQLAKETIDTIDQEAKAILTSVSQKVCGSFLCNDESSVCAKSTTEGLGSMLSTLGFGCDSNQATSIKFGDKANFTDENGDQYYIGPPVGDTTTNNCWVKRLNSAGVQQWKQFYENDNKFLCTGQSIQKGFDGNLWGIFTVTPTQGMTDSQNPLASASTSGAFSGVVFPDYGKVEGKDMSVIVKINKDTHVIENGTYLYSEDSNGSPNTFYTTSIELCQDNSFVVFGSASDSPPAANSISSGFIPNTPDPNSTKNSKTGRWDVYLHISDKFDEIIESQIGSEIKCSSSSALVVPLFMLVIAFLAVMI
jgi:hypothetical protein